MVYRIRKHLLIIKYPTDKGWDGSYKCLIRKSIFCHSEDKFDVHQIKSQTCRRSQVSQGKLSMCRDEALKQLFFQISVWSDHGYICISYSGFIVCILYVMLNLSWQCALFSPNILTIKAPYWTHSVDNTYKYGRKWQKY